MAGGPLIPGLEEFDRPRRGIPAWIIWIAVLLAAGAGLVLVGGLAGGIGPLGSLGMTSTELRPISYRPTASDAVLQIAIAVPATGICPGDRVTVTPIERADVVQVEAMLTRPRNASCESTGISEDRVWVDVSLDAPRGSRGIVREADGAPLPRESG